MKITIYELLGMVKDGKAPKKIRAYENFWVWNKEQEEYIQENKGSKMFGLFCDFLEGTILDSLNDTVEILEEEKKIPEKLPYYSLEKIQKAKNKDECREERISLLEKRVEDLHIKMNELLDYLKSKGDE